MHLSSPGEGDIDCAISNLTLIVGPSIVGDSVVPYQAIVHFPSFVQFLSSVEVESIVCSDIGVVVGC